MMGILLVCSHKLLWGFLFFQQQMDNRLDNFIINNNCLLKNKENNVCSGIADMNKKKHEE